MYGQAELFRELKQLGLKQSDTVLIHSSYRSLGGYQGGPEALIQSLMTYFGEAGLLILPTHSWATVNEEQPLFDPLTTPACVGILPNLFFKQAGVERSLHPTHSVAAYGHGAATYLQGEETMRTPCGQGGCWEKLIPLGAKIVFLGATLKTNTFIHGVEEWNQIPNRLTLAQSPLYVLHQGAKLVTPQHRHIDDVSQVYDKLEPALLAKGIAHEGRLGKARVVVCQAPAMASFVSDLLQAEPNLFGHPEPLNLKKV